MPLHHDVNINSLSSMLECSSQEHQWFSFGISTPLHYSTVISRPWHHSRWKHIRCSHLVAGRPPDGFYGLWHKSQLHTPSQRRSCGGVQGFGGGWSLLTQLCCGHDDNGGRSLALSKSNALPHYFSLPVNPQPLEEVPYQSRWDLSDKEWTETGETPNYFQS